MGWRHYMYSWYLLGLPKLSALRGPFLVGTGTWQSCAKGSFGLCLSNERMNVHPRSVVCHPEKKSDGKSEYLLPTAPSKPVAPRFLQGLSDLKVMDGSQVTMTVQVSGLTLHLFPRGVCGSGHGCNTGICP